MNSLNKVANDSNDRLNSDRNDSHRSEIIQGMVNGSEKA
jgi:hypothetical protein